MGEFLLSAEATAVTLREFHLRLRAGESFTLRLEEPERYAKVDAVLYGAFVQALFTWIDADRSGALEVPALSGRGVPDSDLHLIGMVLAKRINGVAREELTPETRDALAKALARKNFLPLSPGMSSEPRSIVLASHLLRYKTSPDLHAIAGGVAAIEENARSLYHDIWRTTDDARTLRAPLAREDERAFPPPPMTPTHVARTKWPDRHPLAKSGRDFVPLVRRAVQPRGLASRIYDERLNSPDLTMAGIGSVLFELIQNTEWHASGPGRASGIEGCRVFRFVEETFSRAELSQIGNPGFQKYVENVLGRPASLGYGVAKSVTLAVVSIIDHGIGLARSAADRLNESHLLSDETEVQYLIQALWKGVRVSPNPTGNIGLPLVQQWLTNFDGFMLIRTGGTEIRRDFVAAPYERIAKRGRPRPPVFLDWVPMESDEFLVGPRVGTDITIAVPVDYGMESVQ